jgi:hypothetical protein
MVGACGDLGGDSGRKIQKYYITYETKDTGLLASFASIAVNSLNLAH